MQKNDRIRVQHMLDAAEEIILFTDGKTRDSLNDNRMLLLSVVKNLEIIGEAATKVTEETRRELQEIPWPEITSMRNRLIHGYFDIDVDIVWSTIQIDLGPLRELLKKALA
ncbi:DUF86 domain-containing protein [candidate division TA06 bacterium]|uniref:DUF86 domain-containing protein n=1 Tax=candidate division TA06 bacterium TaxID=2250710 RepID=A0A933I8X1_UNCT6|nr:DUF86 domain-containing protein [candidate division TA06 bacterium]